MTRPVPSVWVLLLAAPVAAAAPAKPADGPPVYFPTTVGSTSVYRATAGSGFKPT